MRRAFARPITLVYLVLVASAACYLIRSQDVACPSCVASPVLLLVMPEPGSADAAAPPEHRPCCLEPGSVNEDVDMRGWSLKNLPLASCTFEGCDLRGADMRGADLRYARFERCDLRGACLEGANLWCATYDRATRWPEGFRPLGHWAWWVE
jgi:hypothetical protein